MPEYNPDSDDFAFQPGQTVSGNFRIERMLGEGSYGQVYLAVHTLKPEIKRAIKVLRRKDAGVSDEIYRETARRFHQEAALGAHLKIKKNPHLLEVYDFDETPERLLMWMDYAPGGSLQEKLEQLRKSRQLLPIDQVVEWGIQIAEGLAGLHDPELDVVHRDLHPGNILFDKPENGRVMIADLGLAQMPGGSSMRYQSSIPLPHPGHPSYRSPEHENPNRSLTPAADVYVLGMLLFEMLTGEKYINHEGRGPRALRKEVPLWLDNTIKGMLSKEVEKRPRNGFEAAARLRKSTWKPPRLRPITHKPENAKAPAPEIPDDGGRTPRNKWLILGGIAALALIVGFIVWGIITPQPPNPTGAAGPVVTLASISAAKSPGAPPVAEVQITMPPAPSAPAEKVKIGISMSDFAGERWKTESDLMKQLLEEKGYEVLVSGASYDAKLQNDQIDNMVAQGVKGLIIVAEDGDSAATSVDKAAAAGVKVIAYDRLIKTDKIAAYLSFDNVEVGRNQADGVMKAMDMENWDVAANGKARIVMLGGSPTDNNAVLVRKGQEEVTGKYADKIEVVADQWVTNWDPAIALKMMENILTAAGNDIDGVVASNDGTALGALQAMKAQGLAGKAPISGQDATADGCNSIVKGELTVTVYKDVRKLASKAVGLMDNLIQGNPVPGLKTISLAERTGDSSYEGNIQAYFLPVVQVTRDNVYDEIVVSGFQPYDTVYNGIPETDRPARP